MYNSKHFNRTNEYGTVWIYPALTKRNGDYNPERTAIRQLAKKIQDHQKNLMIGWPYKSRVVRLVAFCVDEFT